MKITIKTTVRWRRLLSVFARSLVFGVVYAGMYIISLHFEIPMVDTLGVIRVTIVAIGSKLVEEIVFKIVKDSILLETTNEVRVKG